MLRPVGFVFLLGREDSLSTSTTHISTIESLRKHVQGALELEHSTLPPYLCALFSIHAGTNVESAEVIRSVFIEEMLHLALAANVLNAIGGAPTLNEPGFLPNYPTSLPHSDNSFEVPLAPFTPETIETFMRVERPGERHAESEADNFETIGQFYRAIEEGIKYLCATLGEDAVFSGDPDRQITPAMLGFYRRTSSDRGAQSQDGPRGDRRDRGAR